MGILKRVPLLRRTIEIAYTMLIVILLSVIVGLILALPVMWLWNFTLGDFWPNMRMEGIKGIFQAWALNILAAILFGKTTGGSKK